MATAKRIDATQGELLPQMLRYSFPLLLSTLAQQLFNSVDVAVLGNLADTQDVAAVGATSILTSLMLYLFLGLSAGANILLARALGARDPERGNRIASTALLFALGSGILVGCAGWLFTRQLVTWMNCPADCFEGAVTYVRFYCLSVPAVVMQNFASGILTTAGNTRSPLIYMLAGGTAKVVLTVVLCLLLPEKTAAVALASGLSQLLWAALLLRRLYSGADAVQLPKGRPQWDGRVLAQFLALGLPISLSKALFPFANMQIQATVNTLGTICVAGNSAVSSLEHILTAFTSTAGSTCAVFVGQNLGAEKPERVWSSIRLSLLLALLVVNPICILVSLTARFWLTLMLPDAPLSVDSGMIRVYNELIFYGMHGVNTVLSQIYMTFGYSLLGTIKSIVLVLGARLLWVKYVFSRFGTYAVLYQVFPVSWLLMFLFDAAICAVVLTRYRKGIYKRL